MQSKDTLNHMETIVAGLKKDPKRWYKLSELQEKKVMPWAKNGRTIRKILDADRKGPNLLKSQITGIASQRRYLVQGQHLIKYLLIYGPGLMALVRNSKRAYGKSRTDKSKTAPADIQKRA